MSISVNTLSGILPCEWYFFTAYMAALHGNLASSSKFSNFTQRH